MPKYTFTFEVDDRRAGSRLINHGVSPHDGDQLAAPKIKSGDTLAVDIQFGGAGDAAPQHLTGHFMISAAPAAPQAMPSPFRIGTSPNYLCYDEQTVTWTAPDNANPYYQFPGLTCQDGQDGNYELTFILECTEDGPYKDRQWSIDPEFDTGN